MKRIEVKKGDRYGRLTILKETEQDNRYERRFLARCDCGNKKIFRLSKLREGVSKSCGCYGKEQASKSSLKHGMSRSRFYYIWASIKGRVINKKSKAYKDYGGRGVKICDSWQKFENFYKDMKDSYDRHVNEFGEKQTTIDRIDNNGDYCKENCRWATYVQQNRNRRSNRFLTFKRKTLTCTEWSKLLNISKGTISKRLNKYGWSVEKTLTTPILR